MKYPVFFRLGMVAPAAFVSALFLSASAHASVSANERYPYNGAQFNRFVAESYRQPGMGRVAPFTGWVEFAYKKAYQPALGKAFVPFGQETERRRLFIASAPNAAERTKRETQTAAWLHKTIKKIVPRFSLDRGFEMANLPRLGERQCFSQSVLLASLLQKMGVDAGVAMVYQNPEGEESNNGHAVTLMKRADGTDIITDCSHPQPFVRQQGLFLSLANAGGYRFAEVVYEAKSGARANVIKGYRVGGGGDGKSRTVLAASRLRPLDTAFIASQFDYYRGERAKKGLLGSPMTPAGLETEAAFLRRSVRACPRNPLAVYMLGRVYAKQNKKVEARKQIANAYKIYVQAGHVPLGEREMVASLR